MATHVTVSNIYSHMKRNILRNLDILENRSEEQHFVS